MMMMVVGSRVLCLVLGQLGMSMRKEGTEEIVFGSCQVDVFVV